MTNGSRLAMRSWSTLGLFCLASCSTSLMTGKTSTDSPASAANAAAPAAPSVSGATDASGNAQQRTAIAGGTGGGGVISIFTSSSFPSLTSQDASTAGCYLPQTGTQLTQLATTQTQDCGWSSETTTSGNASSWGGGYGRGYGGGGYGSSGMTTAMATGTGSGSVTTTNPCTAWNGSDSTSDGGYGGGGYGGGYGGGGYGGHPQMPGTATATASGSTATANSSGSAVGFNISQCNWAQQAAANNKPGLMIVLDGPNGSVFAQPYGNATDAATTTACDAAAIALQTALGGTATCEPIPL